MSAARGVDRGAVDVDGFGVGVGEGFFDFVEEVERDRDDDGVAAGEEAEFEGQRGLVVEDALPPVGGDEFGDDDGDVVVAPAAVEFVEVVDDDGGEVAVGGFEDFEGDGDAVAVSLWSALKSFNSALLIP